MSGKEVVIARRPSRTDKADPAALDKWVSQAPKEPVGPEPTPPTAMQRVADIAPAEESADEEVEHALPAIKRLTIDLAPAVHQRFKMTCVARNTSMVDVVREYIDLYIQQDG